MASVSVLTSMGIYIFDDSDRFSLGGERADPTLSLLEYKIQQTRVTNAQVIVLNL